ncbi:hypothetical protein C1646_748468 [Rhizophagus diaphanus]|nr:hypothetical protein C1646_748468 [Rhizophagus diaphanus] [Rhizophagus sp. MUCL 43196]
MVLQQFLVYKDGKIIWTAFNDRSPIQKCPFFDNIYVTKYVRECQRIKHRSFADSDLINAEHCEVDFESDIYKQINK